MSRKIARITNNKRLLIKGELIEENYEPTSNIDLEGTMRGWSGGYTIDPDKHGVYHVEGLRGGFLFPRTMFEIDEIYILSFKVKKTSGDILSIGGHAQSFKDMEVYLDNELIGSNWNGELGDTYPNDDLEHNYRVILKFDGTAIDSNLYIQPNRDNRYATEYTAEIYDLRLEMVNKSMPNLSLSALGDLTIPNEIIEYHPELEGGRNLLPTKYEYFVMDDGLYGWFKLAEEKTNIIAKVYDTGADVDMAGIYFGITETGKNYTGKSSWLMANGALRGDELITDSTYFSFYGKSRDVFDRIFEKYKIKVETGDKATPWTPAPEDLGLNYPSDIQSFGLSISDNNIIVPEFIEGFNFGGDVIG